MLMTTDGKKNTTIIIDFVSFGITKPVLRAGFVNIAIHTDLDSYQLASGWSKIGCSSLFLQHGKAIPDHPIGADPLKVKPVAIYLQDRSAAVLFVRKIHGIVRERSLVTA